MSEQTPVVETPPTETPVADVVEAPLSIMEHVAQFDPTHRETPEPETPETPEPQAPLAANATAEERAAHHSEQQRREKESGKFAPGKKRHRAASQQASADDAPRIKELTRQLNELKAKIGTPPIAAPAPTPAQAAPPAPASTPVASASAPQRWLGDPKDPEPQEKDFGGDPMKYLSARFQWEARGVLRYDRAEQQQQQQVLQRSMSWAQRVEKAAEKYPDYAAVAFGPTTIPAGSPMDRFIDADDNGAEVLYHLQANPTERDAVLRLPVHQQLKHLALLSQRYDTASTPSAAAGKTGSVPRAAIRILPKPPNPVRTEAQRAETTPAPTDGSLGIRAHAQRWNRR